MMCLIRRGGSGRQRTGDVGGLSSGQGYRQYCVTENQSTGKARAEMSLRIYGGRRVYDSIADGYSGLHNIDQTLLVPLFIAMLRSILLWFASMGRNDR